MRDRLNFNVGAISRSQAGAWERGIWNYAYALKVKTGFNSATTPTISASTCASITGWIGL